MDENSSTMIRWFVETQARAFQCEFIQFLKILLQNLSQKHFLLFIKLNTKRTLNITWNINRCCVDFKRHVVLVQLHITYYYAAIYPLGSFNRKHIFAIGVVDKDIQLHDISHVTIIDLLPLKYLKFQIFIRELAIFLFSVIVKIPDYDVLTTYHNNYVHNYV